MSDGDDLFACFGEDTTLHQTEDDNHSTVECTRDSDCGVLSFHRGTEQSLLVYVQGYLEKINQYDAKSVLEAIDSFCSQRHWMMHIGPEKSKILQDRVKSYTVASRRKKDKRKFIVLEIGTYCGYSSISWANTLQQLESINENYHIYTIEANLEYSNISQHLIELAGLESHISVLHIDLDKGETITDVISKQKNNKSKISEIDVLFLDHDKDAYLTDLIALEKAKLVCKGVQVIADNVTFAKIENYRSYIQHLVESKIVRSSLINVPLEYSQPEQACQLTKKNPELLEDGIEFTIYLEDPPTSTSKKM